MSNKPYTVPATELLHQRSLLLKGELVKEVTRTVEEAQLAQETKIMIIQVDCQKYCPAKGANLYMLPEEIQT